MIGFLMGIAPQFFLASNLADFSEVKSAAAGGAGVAIAGIAKWIFSHDNNKDAS